MENPTQSTQFALLRFDGIQLAFPQGEVVMVDLAADIQSAASEESEIGYLVQEAQKWPVIALSKSFKLLSHLPPERRFCVCFGAGEDEAAFALACDEVASLALEEVAAFQPMLECMQSPLTPVQHLGKHAEQLVLVVSTETMRAYMNPMRKQDA